MASFDFDVVSAQPSPKALAALAAKPVAAASAKPAPVQAAPTKSMGQEVASRR